ncbi:MAG: beta-glucuronidase [Bacteroidota bacterium]
MLYPQENIARELRILDGFWDFRIDPEEIGETDNWPLGLPDAEPMTVPASFNELVAKPELRDYLGSVWYLRRFFVPASWAGRRIWLRFGSVHYRSTVWVNGKKLLAHEGGHLPFAEEATACLKPGEENVVAVRVNNILDWTTIPPGRMTTITDTDLQALQYRFDFFNYAGIHRSVWLYTTAETYLADLTIRTDLTAAKARVAYDLDIRGGSTNKSRITILDADGKIAAVREIAGRQGEFLLDTFNLWSPDHPYLYKMRVELLDGQDRVIDAYTEEFGIRTIEVRDGRLLLNGEPLYLKGVGRHDDFHLVGRGQLLPLIQKDLNLLKWLGANSYRTSHYPYAEEMMRLSDRLGLLVIDEVPAVGMTSPDNMPVFTPERINSRAQETHCRMVRELYARDKNHPSVIVWSVGNEPDSSEEGARPYFEPVVETIRHLDASRPVTLVLHHAPETDRCGELVDLIFVNRYYAWYNGSGVLESIGPRLKASLRKWREKYGKPVMLAEFGADTIAGLHSLPPQMFTEEYQVELLRATCEALDELDFIIGEHVWNLADFAAPQTVTRVLGNRKGIFTRERQPKMAAHYLRSRWRG